MEYKEYSRLMDLYSKRAMEFDEKGFDSKDPKLRDKYYKLSKMYAKKESDLHAEYRKK